MLTETQVNAFLGEGFTVASNVFSLAEVQEMRQAFQRLEQVAYRLRKTRMFKGSWFVLDPLQTGSTPGVRLHRIVWCGAAEPVLSRYGKDPRLVRMASQLLGSPQMHQLINQAHFKLPDDGVAFPWHQDSTHRRYGQGQWKDVNGRGSYVQTVVAIDDVTEENGPLTFIPGSCRQGHLNLRPDGFLPDSLISSRAVTPTMTAGSVLLFGPYTIHCSKPNRSSRPRRVFINGYAYPGANTRLYPGRGAGRLVRATADRRLEATHPH